MSITPALRRQRQEDQELRPAWTTQEVPGQPEFSETCLKIVQGKGGEGAGAPVWKLEDPSTPIL